MKKSVLQKMPQSRLLRSIAGAAILAVALASGAKAQTLLHRYSFVSDASDSVGGANGSIVTPSGGSAVTISNGLTLFGGGGPGFSGYVTLPSGILNSTASLTIECWATQSSQQGWAELFSFNNGQGQYLSFIPYPDNNNNNMSMAIKNGNESDAFSSVQFPVGVETYVACTFDTNTLVGDLYTNAGLVASVTVPNSTYTPGTFNTANNWLGQDPYPDPQFQGTIYELRIWNGVVSQRYLQASAIVGPGTIINNLTPTSASLTAGSTVVLGGAEQATFTVTLSQTGADELLATADATNWTSSNPGVLIVNSSGAIEGVGLGTATVSAKVAGVSATSATITVTNPQLLHRYSFVSDASDSVGGANGTVVPPSTNGTAVTINNGLTLPGGGGPGFSGYVTLPQGVLNGAPSLTVECWATQSSQNTWAELFSFNNGTPQYLAFIPFPQNNGENMVMAVRSNNNEYDASSGVKFPVGVETYIAETFNAYSLQGALYTNGALIATTTVPDSSYIPASWNTANNYLGQDPWPDPQFQGTMYELRVWDGVVSSLYLQVSSAAGSTIIVTNLVPTTLNVNLTTSSMVGSGTQQATVVGNFPQVSGVNVTTAATNWVSSNPSILTVNSSGLITAVNGGSAKVSATVGGVTATSASITVATTPPTFSQLPSGQSAAVGDTVTLSAVALGGSLSYQWSLNSSPISGATNPTLVLANIQLNQAGSYTLSVTNSQGHTNASATVSVVQAILEHRYSFVSDASDSVGGANGTVINPTNGIGLATINNGLNLPGNAAGGFGVTGYVSLPNGLLTNTTSLTIECWATQNPANTWATIWDFADNGGINFELCPFPNRNGGDMIVAFTPNNNEQDLLTPVSFPNGTEQYVALTVNGGTLLSQLYTNGTLVGSLTLPNSTYLPRNIGGNGGTVQDMLGNDTYGDPQFSGTLYEFRIWDGAVTPLYLAVSVAAGPSVVVTSTVPSSIAVSLTTTTMIGGQTQDATATGTFPQASGVALNSFVTNWSSSNPSAISVDTNGVVTAVGVGTATVSAMVNGSTGTSATITVQTSLPVITQQPTASESLLAGATLSTTIANEGTPPFVYRWYLNDNSTLLKTSTNNAALTVPNVSLSSAGNYYCVVSNQYGTATSSDLALTVVTPTTYQSAVMSYGPVAFWPLNESSGSIAYDVVGGDNGTYEGGYTLGVPGPGNSFFGGQTAANFDGNVAIVDIPEGMLNITNAITVVAWVQLSGLNGFDGIVGHGDTSWRITVDGSGIPGANDGAPPADAYNSSAHINDGNWHMLAYAYDGFAGQNFNGLLYLDGSLIASNSVTPAPAGNNLDVWIGGSPDYGTGSTKRIIAGNIADVAVFAEGLNASQVAAIYNGTFVFGPNTLTITPSGQNVVLNWQEGTLLQAPSPSGPWTTNYSAAPPYTVPATNDSQFFRLLLNPH